MNALEKYLIEGGRDAFTDEAIETYRDRKDLKKNLTDAKKQ